MRIVKGCTSTSYTFYHSSKEGLSGSISPYCNDENKKRDFGDGFYLGDKKKQTIALVNSCPEAKLYEIKIPIISLNTDNTLLLSKEDWMYFVLYNRGKLDPIKGTDFYKYYEHLADKKQFIIGSIADDVFSTCMKDFANGIITDYTFMQLIDCYSYGTQIVAKTEEVCKTLNENIVSVKDLTAEERMESLTSRKLNRSEQEKDYVKRRAELISLRKGKYISELFNDILMGKITEPTMDYTDYRNIEFDSPIHDERNDDNEYSFY